MTCNHTPTDSCECERWRECEVAVDEWWVC